MTESPFVEECIFSPEFDSVNFESDSGGFCKAPGIDVELLLFVAQTLNFTVSFMRANRADDEFDALRRNLSDMIISPRSVTQMRYKAGRHSSFPVDELKYKILMRTPDPTDLHLNFLVTPFGADLWNAMVLTAFGLTLVFLGCCAFKFIYKFRVSRKLLEAEHFPASNSSMAAGVSSLNAVAANYGSKNRKKFQTNDNNAKQEKEDWAAGSSGLRLLMLVCGFSATLLLAFYPNVLTLALSHKITSRLPFANAYDLADALMNKEYQLVVPVQGNGVWATILCPTDGYDHPFYVKMNEACKSNHPLVEPQEDRLLQFLLQNGSLVTVFTEAKLITLEPRYNGQYSTVDTGLPTRFRFYWFRKDTEYDIPNWIMEIIAEKYAKLVNTYADRNKRTMLQEVAKRLDENPMLEPAQSEKIKPLSLLQVQEAFWLILTGGLFAFFLLVFEYVICYVAKVNVAPLSGSSCTELSIERASDRQLQSSSDAGRRKNSCCEHCTACRLQKQQAAFLNEAAEVICALSSRMGHKLNEHYNNRLANMRHGGNSQRAAYQRDHLQRRAAGVWRAGTILESLNGISEEIGLPEYARRRTSM